MSCITDYNKRGFQPMLFLRRTTFILVLISAISIRADDTIAPLPKDLRAGVKQIPSTDIHNFFALGTNIYSGSSPDSEKGFAELAKLGIKTIISVDGALPDLDVAHKYGLRYVHLPHGYDGIEANTQLQLIKAVQTLPGPFFVHCHHGKHRGPTAAAIMCMSSENWSASDADAWLKAAGTAPNYVGLYKTVADFRTPSTEMLKKVPANLPEQAKVSGLVDAMVAIDKRWDHLKAVQKAGYKVPKEHPDINPANEAVILWEQFRESQRLTDSTKLGADFLDQLKHSEAEVRKVEKTLSQFAGNPTPELRAELDTHFASVTKACSTCHKKYRD